MNINKELKIADVVSENIKTADIFKKYGIDFCCGGGISIFKACEKKNIDYDELINELNHVDKHGMPTHNFNKWGLDFLADYIVNTHHAYVLDAFVLLDAYTNKVSKVHGVHHPPVLEIERFYQSVKAELLQHMHKEEGILFPYIKQLIQIKNGNDPKINFPFGSIQIPIQLMEKEHQNAGDALRQIATLSNNYTTPEWACNTFKALYAKLDEFEQDLHLHVHLENNILFPKAIDLEINIQLLN
ncbi:MAG: iron-sulfur cluster repair di-iron protein [Bacteroidetes bacterium]|jgi:regulator of cell morphogenesis and NO signaling|nr:iron-sulfur cluster repair di-iron protein [Bacteroidota bacterium]HQW45680.1 iron-sulfur cluster repair di-iron protein [Chitinophagaceae bacterium]MBK6818583.1 iron-sulfur cluster repair di-iron protein [Bacteroidota bacterium]MBK7041237.1 iron-sulfur cluster repair di-iron protein [Bacteroidota bacterium]MBK7588620.1 iron-sulfur cluster repair di-iron protein [Bacteroidota bacterium]